MELAQPSAPRRAQAGSAVGLLASSDDQGTCKRQWRGAYREPSSARGMEQAPDGKIEITLPDGTSIKVGHDVGLVALRRVMTVLRRCLQASFRSKGTLAHVARRPSPRGYSLVGRRALPAKEVFVDPL
jgi:hypothetical protein